jgi:hypothetical protein
MSVTNGIIHSLVNGYPEALITDAGDHIAALALFSWVAVAVIIDAGE